ncbi:extracellular solute-binding protein [Pseudactinotalea sp.]|uniref:extracellular solute-binding protein n=1 Tax=Pseudactinotalea sp. TaxID=1926260 RepID=UPI003B3B73DD
MVDRHGPTRRQLLRTGAGALGAAAIGAPLLAGCSPGGGSGGRIDLDFWHLLSGGDGIKMADLIDAANAQSETYSVKPTVLAWGAPYYTKLAMASAGGRAPDVAIMHASRLPGYAPGGLLDPWDIELLAEVGVTEERFPGPIWQQGTSDGSLYSIALDAHPFLMMYNPEICDRAGVLGSDGQIAEITSPDDFIEVASAIQGVTGVHGLSYGYLGDGAQMWRLWYTLYRQHGAEMVLTGDHAEYELDAAVSALEFMQQLLDDTICSSSSDYANAVAEFAGGSDSGLFFTGVWELPTMIDAGIPLDASTIPTLFGTDAAYGDSHAFVLPHQDNPDPEARRASYQFVSDLLGSSFRWAEAGHIPAFLPITESPEYSELVPQAHYAGAADILNYDPEAWFSGSGSNFQEYFAEYVQGVLLAGNDAAAGFEAFMRRVDALIRQPNPVAGSGGSS